MTLFCTASTASNVLTGIRHDWNEEYFLAAMHEEPNLNRSNRHTGDNALHIAVRLNRPRHIGWLMTREDARPMLLRPNLRNRTPIEEAIQGGHVEAFCALLRFLPPDTNFRIENRYRWTLAHIAARYGQITMIRALEQAGHPIDEPDNSGWTPLQVAMQFKPQTVRAIRQLIEARESSEVVAILAALGGRADDEPYPPEIEDQEDGNEPVNYRWAHSFPRLSDTL